MPDEIAGIVADAVEVAKEIKQKPINVVGEPLPETEDDYKNPNKDIETVKLKPGERYLTPAEAKARREEIRRKLNNQQPQ